MNTQIQKPLFIYTLFSSLGDFIVMGDLIHKVETIIPGAKAIAVHRNNPHIKQWKYPDPASHFYNAYSLSALLDLMKRCQEYRKQGYTVFGIQQAPGSLQGFFFLKTLKRLGVLDYVVDFNLYNADIITPSEGNYILDLHLNQLKKILKTPMNIQHQRLALPYVFNPSLKPKDDSSQLCIGIHPWSSRDNPTFTWSFPKWMDVIKRITIKNERIKIIIFGKNKNFEKFKKYLEQELPSAKSIHFAPSASIQELTETVAHVDVLVSVNTSVVHIGYALNKRMVILCGPTLNFWIPKGENSEVLMDERASLPGSDKLISNNQFPRVENISTDQVVTCIEKFL